MPVFNSVEKAAQAEQCEMLQWCLGLVRDQPAQIAWDSHQENPSREHHCRGQHRGGQSGREGKGNEEEKAKLQMFLSNQENPLISTQEEVYTDWRHKALVKAIPPPSISCCSNCLTADVTLTGASLPQQAEPPGSV